MTKVRRKKAKPRAEAEDPLDKLAREVAECPDDAVPFGDWLVAISRPGIDLDEALDLLRSAPARPAPPE